MFVNELLIIYEDMVNRIVKKKITVYLFSLLDITVYFKFKIIRERNNIFFVIKKVIELYSVCFGLRNREREREKTMEM